MAPRSKILYALLMRLVLSSCPPKLESALQSGSDEVLDLSEDFRKISLFVEMKLLVASFYEQRSTFGLGSRVRDLPLSLTGRYLWFHPRL